MKDQDLQIHTFDNGLTLVAEPMTDVQSASFSMLVPGGSVFDPQEKNGTASVLCELITRGAGKYDSRELSAAFDNLGVQRSESVGCYHQVFSGAMLADNLADALRLYADVLRRPHLPEDQFEAAKSSVELTLLGIEDEPQQKLIVELRRRCYSVPWSLPTDGTLEQLDDITPETVRSHFESCFRPNGMIVGVAGRLDFEQVKQTIGELFGDWKQQPELPIREGQRGALRDHIHDDTAQTHIGIAYDAVPYRDPDYYAAWAAVGVLSGGMSSRLFTEVREKRALCYSVYASLHGLPHEGRVLCYAGSSSDRAQETLDVTLQEIKKLGEGIEPHELDRCKARAKSSLIMQQESTIARSSSIARDWFHLGRVTTLAEVRDKIEALTVERVLDYVHSHEPREFNIMTIGPQALEVRS